MSEDGRASSPPPARSRLDPRLVIALSLSALVVAGAIALALVTRRGSGGCGQWEGQLRELSESLTRHRLAKGPARLAAIDDLQGLELPCQKVASARDQCAAAYRHILLAESEQAKAKATVRRIEEAVAGLDEPWRTVSRLRLLQDASMSDLAQQLGVTEEEARSTLDQALEKLGPDRLDSLRSEFEGALKRSQQNIEAGSRRNAECDRSFKRLLEEAQDR